MWVHRLNWNVTIFVFSAERKEMLNEYYYRSQAVRVDQKYVYHKDCIFKLFKNLYLFH